MDKYLKENQRSRATLRNDQSMPRIITLQAICVSMALFVVWPQGKATRRLRVTLRSNGVCRSSVLVLFFLELPAFSTVHYPYLVREDKLDMTIIHSFLFTARSSSGSSLSIYFYKKYVSIQSSQVLYPFPLSSINPIFTIYFRGFSAAFYNL